MNVISAFPNSEKEQIATTTNPGIVKPDGTSITVNNDGTIHADTSAITDLLTDKNKTFNFGVDDNGNYGYYKDGADTVTPFKNPTGTKTDTYRANGTYSPDVTDYETHQVVVDVQSATGNASPANVESGYTFSNSSSIGATGTLESAPSGAMVYSDGVVYRAANDRPVWEMAADGTSHTVREAKNSVPYIGLNFHGKCIMSQGKEVGIPASTFGNASASQVLSSATFTSENGKAISGTIENKGSFSYTPTLTQADITSNGNYTVRSSAVNDNGAGYYGAVEVKQGSKTFNVNVQPSLTDLDARGVRVIFEPFSKSESISYDYVDVIGHNGSSYVYGRVAGTSTWPDVVVPTHGQRYIYIYWKSDSSQQYWGFKIAAIVPAYCTSAVGQSTGTYSSLPRSYDTTVTLANCRTIQTSHDYSANESYCWRIDISSLQTSTTSSTDGFAKTIYVPSMDTTSRTAETAIQPVSETISSAKTYNAGYYSNSWTVTPQGSTPTGNATPSQVLSGYTFSSASYPSGSSGNITTQSASSETISSAKTYYSGYYPNSWTVTPQGATGNAGPNQVLSGYTFSSASYPSGTSGNIVTRSPASVTPVNGYYDFSSGYYGSSFQVRSTYQIINESYTATGGNTLSFTLYPHDKFQTSNPVYLYIDYLESNTTSNYKHTGTFYISECTLPTSASGTIFYTNTAPIAIFSIKDSGRVIGSSTGASSIYIKNVQSSDSYPYLSSIYISNGTIIIKLYCSNVYSSSYTYKKINVRCMIPTR